MPFLNLPSVRGADEPVSGSALGRVARRAWAIITDSDDGHVKLKKPDDTLLDLEAGGGSFNGGTITEPLVIDAPPVFSNGGVDRAFSVVDQFHEITLEWDYDGGANLTATISGGYPGMYALLTASDDLSGSVHGYFTDMGDLTLAVTDVGWDTGGPDFVAHVHVAVGLLADTSTDQTFTFGTAAARTAVYRPGVFAVESGPVIRTGLGIYATFDGATIWIVNAEVPGETGIGHPRLRLSSADGFTNLFVLNRFGGITIDTADGSSPIILPNIPTDDPLVVGALWNQAGTVKVSAGPPP